MQPVADLPLHRRLGLTDGELERITADLGRDPNAFELAVYSLLWSEHCGYKHSALLLRRLPTEGPRVLQGPGENAGRDRRRRRPRRGLQGREPQPPVGRRALPGRRHRRRRHPPRHLRDGRAADRRARLAAVRLARQRALPPPVRRLRPRHRRTTATASASPTSAARSCSTTGYDENCLVNAMCVGMLADRARCCAPGRRARATWSCCSAPSPGATASAAPSCSASPDLDEDDEDKRAQRAGRRPVHREAADRVLARAGRARAAACRCRTWAPPASPRSTVRDGGRGGVGLELDLDRVPLREEGMSRSRS